jgi:hypothetical protein
MSGRETEVEVEVREEKKEAKERENQGGGFRRVVDAKNFSTV